VAELHDCCDLAVVQGGDALERAHAVTTVIFDKTGTLTQGCMVVASVQLFQKALTTDQVRSAAPSHLLMILKMLIPCNQLPHMVAARRQCCVVPAGAESACCPQHLESPC